MRPAELLAEVGRGAALSVDAPALAAAFGILVAGLLALAWWRGPASIIVPAAPAGAGRGTDAVGVVSLVLRGAALALVGVALAGPAARVPERPAAGSGVDLMVALDASGSMDALDGQLDGSRVTRLDLARRALAALVRQRPEDRIGLVVFGERAFTQSPLTLDHALLLRALERVEVGVAGDSTALGDAIGLAVRRLRAEGGRPDARRVLVVLTDGRHNAGELPPETAGRIAQASGVRTHAIGIGTSGVVPFAPRRPGDPVTFERVDLDRATLERLARTTGGRFFSARQPEDVLAVAEEIHQLETRVAPERTPRYRRASLTPLVLLAALALLAADAAVQFALCRRLP